MTPTPRVFLETNVVYYFSGINQYPKAFQFLHIRHAKDQSPQKYKWFILGEPLQSTEQKIIFNKLRSQGYYFVGISSFNTFPFLSGNQSIDSQHGMDFFNTPGISMVNLMGWLNCHSKENLISHPYPENLPVIDFAESDLSEVDAYYDPKLTKKYDFIYNCQQGDYQRLWRNWSLGFKCLELMVYKYNLKIILIGKKDDPYQPPDEAKLLKHPNVTTTSFLSSHEFLNYVQRSRGLFLPNIYDASPRVGAEALHLNVPILENKHITGGWHYINPETGMSFESVKKSDEMHDLENFEHTLTKFLHHIKHKKFSPRPWMKSNYTPKISSTRLGSFLNSLPQPLYYGNRNFINEFISIIVCTCASSDNLDLNLNPCTKIIYYTKNAEQYDAIIKECESESNTKKHPLFITTNHITLNDTINHHVSLFFDGHPNFDILALNGDIKVSESSDYLYMDHGIKLNNVSQCIVNRSYIKKFLDQYNQSQSQSHSSDLKPREILVFNNSIRPHISETLSDMCLSFYSERNLKSDPRMIDAYQYDSEGHGYGLIYEENTKSGIWKELKNNRIHGNYKLCSKQDDVIILHDEPRNIFVKIQTENGKYMFYVAISKKLSNAMFSCYFELNRNIFDSKWIYDATDGNNYFIQGSDSLWYEYKNKLFWAKFVVEERNEKYLVLYDENRKLHIKLESLCVFVKTDQSKSWGFLSSGFWKYIDPEPVVE
jgi:hypothetical protein